MNKKLYFLIIIGFLGLAQQAYGLCSADSLASVMDCIEGEGPITGDVLTCIATFNDGANLCSTGQVFEEFAKDYIEEQSENKCCSKNGQKKIVNCLKKEKRELRPRTVTKVVGRGVKSGVSAKLADKIDEVKATGQCSSD